MKPLSLGLLASTAATAPTIIWLLTLTPDNPLAWPDKFHLATQWLWLSLAIAAALLGPWTAYLHKGSAQLREVSMLLWIPLPCFAFIWQARGIEIDKWLLGTAALITFTLMGLVAGRAVERFGQTNDVRISGRVALQVCLAMGVWQQSERWLAWL